MEHKQSEIVYREDDKTWKRNENGFLWCSFFSPSTVQTTILRIHCYEESPNIAFAGNRPDRNGNYISFLSLSHFYSSSDWHWFYYRFLCNFNSAKWNENDSKKKHKFHSLIFPPPNGRKTHLVYVPESNIVLPTPSPLVLDGWWRKKNLSNTWKIYVLHSPGRSLSLILSPSSHKQHNKQQAINLKYLSVRFWEIAVFLYVFLALFTDARDPGWTGSEKKKKWNAMQFNDW